MPVAQTQQAPTENRKLAEDIYDLIMGPIEPDLLLGTIPGLDAKYAGETPEEHDARMTRYQEAYKRFDAQLGEFMTTVSQKARETRRDALVKKEGQSKASDSETLDSLEDAFA